MALTLPQRMNEHYGRNVDTMPQLLKAGEVPISTARFMKARLENGEKFPDLWSNYFNTSDLVVYPKRDNKNIYVLLTTNRQGIITPNGRRALELITPDNLASNYGAVVEQLSDIKGSGLIKVSRKKIKTEEDLTQRQIGNSVLWRILARHPDAVPSQFAEDKELLRDYAKEVASKTEQEANMAIYLDDESLEDKTTFKAWIVRGLGNWSDAVGSYYLGDDRGRFVGIAPEALNSPKVVKIAPQENRVYSVRDILGESKLTDDFAPAQITKLQRILEQQGYQIHKKQ